MIALAADRVARAGMRADAPRRFVGVGEMAPYASPVTGDTLTRQVPITLATDPFEGRPAVEGQSAVAPGGTRPTVPSALPQGRQLTAILVADERRVAVIDDEAVTVGATLVDGARVAAILPDRVWVVEKSGRRYMLTLSTRER